MVEVERVVIGGGLFGCYAALLLADQGLKVTLIEQDSQLLSRASFVNQARLHTGLHYPRSILTAKESLRNYQTFRGRFEPAIRDFTQIYAVAARSSQTSGDDFEAFIKRLGIGAEVVNPDDWFHPGKVSCAFAVEEPSFDSLILRGLILEEIAQRPEISVTYNTSVVSGKISYGKIEVKLSDGSTASTEGVVIAAYAGTNAVRVSFGLEPIPIMFELAEVLVGRVSPDLSNLGFTVMDGPFWSLMPFGKTDLVTLTSVGFTPLRTSLTQPNFECQTARPDCRPLNIKDCTSCPVRPASASRHHLQQMSHFLKSAASFKLESSLLTVKAVLQSTQIDDARPTMIIQEKEANVTTVLSGKVSTLFDLDGVLK